MMGSGTVPYADAIPYKGWSYGVSMPLGSVDISGNLFQCKEGHACFGVQMDSDSAANWHADGLSISDNIFANFGFGSVMLTNFTALDGLDVTGNLFVNSGDVWDGSKLTEPLHIAGGPVSGDISGNVEKGLASGLSWTEHDGRVTVMVRADTGSAAECAVRVTAGRITKQAVLTFSDGYAGAVLDFGSADALSGGFTVELTDAEDAASPFTDVKESDWFYGDVLTAYRDGLIEGRSAGIFAPYGDVTLAEAVKLAACMRQYYTEGGVSMVEGSPWYRVYMDYAAEHGIITSGRYEAEPLSEATRAEIAVIFAAALPEEALPGINDVKDGDIPDVRLADSYGAAVYRLYRAGIFEGNDAARSFAPDSNVRRSEIAAVITRMLHADARREFD